MADKQVKSKQRVADHGEVFTAEREVKAMCDLVADECLRIDSRFLEPACGDGNFLAEILTRKLEVVAKRYKKSPYDYERYALLALGSIYGVDILADNAENCRKRLLGLWTKNYNAAIPAAERSDETIDSARFILERNIVCGNALTLMCVDENQNDTATPIVFSEWTFPFNDAQMHRKDYTFSELLAANEESTFVKESGQRSMFENEDGEVEPTFLKEYITHYRRLRDYGESRTV